MINRKSGKSALRTRARALMEEKEGTPIPRVEMMRPTRNEYMREDDLYESSWEEVTRETFSATWSEEVAAARQTVDSEDRKSTRLNPSHSCSARMPSSA